MEDIIEVIWNCGADLTGCANELERLGRKDSEERLREIVNQIENLCRDMIKHPRK